MQNRLRFMLLFLFTSSLAGAKDIHVSIQGFASQYEKPVPLVMEWQESWLEKCHGTEYNHDIARIACLLAQMAYSDIAATYQEFGVIATDMFLHYDIDYGDAQWGNDQCAFSFAHKKVYAARRTQTLLFIVIRGTPGEPNEWFSNLNINDVIKDDSAGIHQGFARAAEQVWKALCAYVGHHHIDTQDCFVLMSGHSRGGAVANLLAAQMIDSHLFLPQDMYVYTFSSPNVTMAMDAQDSRYGCIWNIVNAEDIMPTFPFCRGEAWTFKKYGHVRTLINAWNCNPSDYEKNYLPRMNELHRHLLGMDYHPFRTGSFLPVQMTFMAQNLYGTVKSFYTNKISLHNLATKLLLSSGSYVSEEREGTIAGWLNKKTDNYYDYLLKALADMHMNETYLCWLLALEEEELFSVMGSCQIIVSGNGDGVLLDADGNSLLRFIDGRVQYASVHIPIAARTLHDNRLVIGMPANNSCRLVIGHKSVLPSGVTVTVERYNSYGVLEQTHTYPALYPRQGKSYVITVGNALFTEKDLSITSYSEGLKEKDPWTVRPEIFIMPDLNVGLGVRIGTPQLYGSFYGSAHPSRDGTVWEFASGLGTQLTVCGPLRFDIETLMECVWFPPAQSTEYDMCFVPKLRTSINLQPRRYFGLFIAMDWAFEFRSFNDSYFHSATYAVPHGHISMGDSVRVLPSIQFGILF